MGHSGNIPSIPKDTVRVRNDRVIRLKEELNLILELVVHSREALTNELSSEFAQKKLAIDKPFLTKLKELTACYNSLTDARIRLDKAERSLEKDLSPAEEKEAVRDYVLSLGRAERGKFLKQMITKHNMMLSETIPESHKTNPDIVVQVEGPDED
jgi:hypothetical protein